MLTNIALYSFGISVQDKDRTYFYVVWT